MPRFERHGAAPGPGRAPQDPVHIATDAVVVSTRGIYGLAFLASDGTYGMRLGDQARMPLSAAVEDAKMRAISFAMKRTSALMPPVTVTSDSVTAVAAYNLWQDNPESPDLPPLLRELRPPVGGRDRYTFAWALGGDDPLAGWADSAARLALRIGSGLVERRAAAQMLDDWARARLRDWSHARKD
jgi:hypothetical protein